MIPIPAATTPNPAVRRFEVDGPWHEGPSVERARGDDLGDAPLIEAVLAVDAAVQGAMVGRTFVSVRADWSADLARRVGAVVASWWAEGEPPVVRAEPTPRAAPGEPTLEDKIESILDWDIRPALAEHGGDVTLLGVVDGVVRLHLRGACGSCPSSLTTLQHGIEARLLRSLPELSHVEGVHDLAPEPTVGAP